MRKKYKAGQSTSETFIGKLLFQSMLDDDWQLLLSLPSFPSHALDPNEATFVKHQLRFLKQ